MSFVLTSAAPFQQHVYTRWLKVIVRYCFLTVNANSSNHSITRFHSKRDALMDGSMYQLQVARKRMRATFLLARSDKKKPNAPGICKENIPSKCTATTPSRADVHSHSTPSHSHPVRVEVIDSAQPPSAVKAKPQWFQLRTYQRMLKSSVEPNRIMYSVNCREPISCWPPLSTALKRLKNAWKRWK